MNHTVSLFSKKEMAVTASKISNFNAGTLESPF